MKNPFAFFGLEPSLNIDVKALRKQYLDIQRGAHPDLQGDVAKDSEVSEWANAHYKTLTTRELLVKAYLQTANIENFNDNQLPKTFLMEMMDLSDEIEMMDRNDESSKLMVDGLLVFQENVLNEEFIVFKSSEKVLMNELTLWYQKNKYLIRLRKNFEGIEEM